jgi:LysM repeat protein
VSTSRSGSRWLAPAALLAVALVALLIILSGGGSGEGGSAPQAEPTRTEARSSGPKVYVVKQGDTLSAIAMKAGVTVETLQQLNPDVDVQALQPGQRLRLRQ